MKLTKYFIVFVIVFGSCKTQKNMVATNTKLALKEMSAKKVARKHAASNFSKASVAAKMKVHFNNGKTKQSISVSLKMKKDEVIWLKGTKFITVFKVKITPTSVRYYSPYAKNYFEGDFSMLKKILGVDINFEQFQNLLLGQSLIDIKKEKQDIVIEEDSYLLSPKNQTSLFDIFFSVNPLHFKLDQQTVVNSLKNQRLEVLYPSYHFIEEEAFPAEIKINAKQSDKLTNINCVIKSIEFNTDSDMSFAIPKGYKQLKL